MSTNAFETLKNANRSFRRQTDWMRFTIKLGGGRTLTYTRRPRARWSRLLSKLMFIISAPAFALDPNALPTGGNVVGGAGNIGATGNQMTVTQNTQNMIVNWNTFNIGSQAGVNFVQPNAQSTALNRVLSADASSIMGSLTANGRVFLINPNGVLFGNGARVDVGSMVASTLNITDSNFMAGKYVFEKGAAAGSIVNQGTITAKDGDFGCGVCVGEPATNKQLCN